MARIHDNGLAEIGPIQEGGPVERLLSFHARLGQQFCAAGDPPAIDGRNDPDDVFVLCGPRPYGSVQDGFRSVSLPVPTTCMNRFFE
jgi:hypothetical protein